MIYLILTIIKVCDNIILTLKTILTYSNKRILSSVLVFVSQILFYTVVKQVMADDSILTILIIAGSSAVGNYIAFFLMDKFKKDDKWHFYLNSSNKDDILALCNYLKNNNIKYMANLGLTRNGKETINVMAFSKTKNESRLIENYLKNTNAKYLKEIMKG